MYIQYTVFIADMVLCSTYEYEYSMTCKEPPCMLATFISRTCMALHMIQASPFEHLDLADYVCQELLVSFAVSNKEGLSMFSPAIPLIINGGDILLCY